MTGPKCDIMFESGRQGGWSKPLDGVQHTAGGHGSGMKGILRSGWL